jgi:thiamine phosphate synthase YjbQ (UPF0047 family)
MNITGTVEALVHKSRVQEGLCLINTSTSHLARL